MLNPKKIHPKPKEDTPWTQRRDILILEEIHTEPRGDTSCT